MIKNLKYILFLFPITAFAAGDINTTAELLNVSPVVNSECATAEFNNALAENAYMVSEDDDRDVIRDWIYDILQSPEALGAVLSCPEIVDADELDTIYMPIHYEFPNGRTIDINYETQVKVLDQRFMLATKTELPSNTPNPEISSIDPTATWVNTDPAWYGIMVTQAGALSEFVGPGKNNTVSVEWIEDNIEKLYPHNSDGWCSTKTGMGAKVNNSMVHNVIREHTAKHDGDKNNYYIAGDRDLRWISVAEIAVDIILSVATGGGYTVLSGMIKNARIARIAARLRTTLKSLVRLESVQKYIRHSLQVAKFTKEIDNINDAAKSIRNIERLEQALARVAKGSEDYARIEKQLNAARKLHADNIWKLGIKAESGAVRSMTRSQAKHLNDIERRIQKITSIEPGRRSASDAQLLKKLNQERNTILNKIGTKDPTEIARLKQAALNGTGGERIVPDINLNQLQEMQQTNLKEIENLQKEMAQMAKNDKNVAEYVKEYDALKDVINYSKELKAFKKARSGNVMSRLWQGAKNLRTTVKATRNGTKTLDRAARVARQASKSGMARDWLFHSTMRNAGRITRLGADLAALNFIVGLIGSFWDYAPTESDEFTNGISIKPFLLLSADSIEGQDNVVNYGVWLMWTGNSTNVADDDTAYLQAMDFAQKFFQDLNDVQNETGRYACDVDIYVVRPVIRNPGPDQELYWLVMNDEPWTTATAPAAR